jgi:hypothetical protein
LRCTDCPTLTPLKPGKGSIPKRAQPVHRHSAGSSIWELTFGGGWHASAQRRARRLPPHPRPSHRPGGAPRPRRRRHHPDACQHQHLLGRRQPAFARTGPRVRVAMCVRVQQSGFSMRRASITSPLRWDPDQTLRNLRAGISFLRVSMEREGGGCRTRKGGCLTLSIILADLRRIPAGFPYSVCYLFPDEPVWLPPSPGCKQHRDGFPPSGPRVLIDVFN